MSGIFETVFMAIFIGLAVMVLVWFRRISQLFSYLRQNHPNEYIQMGEPSLILNNTPKNNIAFLRFILGKRPSELGDPELEQRCRFLKVFFYTYTVLFLFLLCSIWVLGDARS